MDDLPVRVETFIRRKQLLKDGEQVIVGLSGGVDSVVLAHLLTRLRHQVTAVHVNYGLRGAAADEDEAFVRSWCGERGVDLRSYHYSTELTAEERGISLQHAARNLRYGAFVEVAREISASRVAVGHHRDDQAETVLLHLFRGTGIEGLAGMPARRRLTEVPETQNPAIGPGGRARQEVLLVRPLLECSREEIESYARSEGLSWRVDSTNTKPAYRRGAVRAEIMPVLERHFGQSVSERIARSAQLVRAYLDASLEPDLRAAFKEAAESADGDGALRLDPLRRLEAVIRRRIFLAALRRWLPEIEATSTRAMEIESLMEAQVGRRLEYGGNSIWRERERLLFRAAGASANEKVGPPNAPIGADTTSAPLELGGVAQLPRGMIRAELHEHPPAGLEETAPNDAYLDARSVRFPLFVRLWQEGDRFSPLGMSGTKKLSDFLTDERVPPHLKKDVYVVLSDGVIVWVAGYRIAHPVRVRDDTTKTVQLSYHPAEN